MKTKNVGWRYWLNLFIAAIIFLVAISIPLLLLVSCRQAQAYLHPPRYIASRESLKANGIEFQDIELIASDGVKLSAWYIPPKNGAVILNAHGYGATRFEDYSVLFASHGYGVLAWDFRAHGQSGGEFSTLGYYEQLDVEAALDYALAQSDVKHVGAWGGSMGGATIILTAADRPEIEALVIDSAYPTLEDVYKINVPLPVFQQMIGFFAEWETGQSINNVRPVDEIGKISPRPVFIIDGWDGAAVTMNAPYRLYDAAGDPKMLWVEEGVPHLNMYGYYREEYTRRVIGFLEEYLK
jgi:fermentation-respiration switch protein FrsA (DUF1100 family)